MIQAEVMFKIEVVSTFHIRKRLLYAYQVSYEELIFLRLSIKIFWFKCNINTVINLRSKVSSLKLYSNVQTEIVVAVEQ